MGTHKSSFLFCVFKPEDMGFISYDYKAYSSQPMLKETSDLNYKVVPLLVTEELDRDDLNYIRNLAGGIPKSQTFHSVVYCLRIPSGSFQEGREISISLKKVEDIVGCIAFSAPRCDDGINICCINALANENDAKHLGMGFLRHPIAGSGQKKVTRPSFILPKKLTDKPEIPTPQIIPTPLSDFIVPTSSQNQHSFWSNHKPEILGLGTAGICACIGATLGLLLLTGVIPPLGMTLALSVFVVMLVSEITGLTAGAGVYALTT